MQEDEETRIKHRENTSTVSSGMYRREQAEERKREKLRGSDGDRRSEEELKLLSS